MANIVSEHSDLSNGSRTGDWTFRMYRDADIPALANLINAVNSADGVETHTDAESLGRDLAMPMSDPLTQIVIAETGSGTLAGYSRVVSLEDTDAGERIYQFTIKVHPDARNKGLEDALAARVVAMARSHSEDAARVRLEKSSMISVVRSENSVMRALMEKIGLRDIRHGWTMERPLGEPIGEPRNINGVVIRHYRRPDDNIAAHDAYNNSFIDHFEYHALPQDFWDYMIGRPEMKPELSWLAEVEANPGDIAGFCITAIKENDNAHTGRKEGWIELLGTVRGWRGKGLGRSLLLNGLLSLREAGIDTALLGVDSESPTGANRLYESVGFTMRSHDILYKCDLSETNL